MRLIKVLPAECRCKEVLELVEGRWVHCPKCGVSYKLDWWDTTKGMAQITTAGCFPLKNEIYQGNKQ